MQKFLIFTLCLLVLNCNLALSAQDMGTIDKLYIGYNTSDAGAVPVGSTRIAFTLFNGMPNAEAETSCADSNGYVGGFVNTELVNALVQAKSRADSITVLTSNECDGNGRWYRILGVTFE